MLSEDLRHVLISRLPQEQPAFSAAKSAATALIITADSLEVLLIERARDPRDPWSGQMALPGGRRDPSDADLIATAIREVKEEVGLQLLHHEFAGFLPSLEALPRRPKDHFIIQPIVFVLKEKADLTLNHEVAESLWVSYQLFQGTENRTKLVVKREGQSLQLPCWEIRSKKIWGLTERMLSSFIELMTPEGKSLLEHLTSSYTLT